MKKKKSSLRYPFQSKKFKAGRRFKTERSTSAESGDQKSKIDNLEKWDIEYEDLKNRRKMKNDKKKFDDDGRGNHQLAEFISKRMKKLFKIKSFVQPKNFQKKVKREKKMYKGRLIPSNSQNLLKKRKEEYMIKEREEFNSKSKVIKIRSSSKLRKKLGSKKMGKRLKKNFKSAAEISSNSIHDHYNVYTNKKGLRSPSKDDYELISYEKLDQNLKKKISHIFDSKKKFHKKYQAKNSFFVIKNLEPAHVPLNIFIK